MRFKSQSKRGYYKRFVAYRKHIIGTFLQESRKHKCYKTLAIIFSALIAVVVIIVLIISPLTKYLVEKYDLKYTGRQISMDGAYVNPFTGYIHFDNLIIHELNSDNIFISVEGVSANFALWKLFSKTYEISELTLNKPYSIIIQIDENLNFDDLIAKFTPKVDSILAIAPIHFSIRRIKIVDGLIYYRERVTPINYFIKKVNIESTGIYWNTDTIAAKFSFNSGIGGGGMKGDFSINTKTLDYRLAVEVEKYDLEIIEQYLRELTNFGYLKGNIDADLKVKGSFIKAENVTFKGLIAISDFSTGETPDDEYASFQKLALSIIELSPKNEKYLFDSVSLNNPYFRYDRYDYLDNLTRMFVTKETKDAVAQLPGAKFNLVLEIGNYIKRLSQNFFSSNYSINKLGVYNGNLEVNDYSLSEKFSIHLDPLNIIVDSISKNQKWINVSINSGIWPYGNATIAIKINPKDSSDFDLNYHLKNLPIAMFNPYLIQYTSFPVDRGTLSLEGQWNVKNGEIASNNHLIVIDPRLSKHIKIKDIHRMPMRLMMSLMRETGNVIDYEVPITGDLNDPNFHLRDIVLDVIKNIFVKPLTTPYRMEVKQNETEIEKSLTLKWGMRSYTLTNQQKKFIEQMAEFLVINPEATIVVSPQQYSVKEKEYILIYEAKKMYFLTTENKNEISFSEEDAEKVEKMSNKDSGFVTFLNQQTADSMLFTIQDKCYRLLDTTLVETKYNQLTKDRVSYFLSYFKNRNVENRLNITADQNVIPFNGYSFYKINYNDGFPKDLVKAYEKMNELNDRAPRNLFKKERKKNKDVL